MKILLIYPPCTPPVEGTFTMPLGVCALKAWLTKYGFESEVLDLNIKLYIASEEKYLWDDDHLPWWNNDKSFNETVLKNIVLQEWIDKIVNSDAEFIGFSVSYQSVLISLYLVKKIKQRTDKKIIFGGPECHQSNVERFFNNGVDAVVVGEGEQSLLELLQNFKVFPGVYLNENGKIVYGGDRDLMDINKLPIPDFDDIIEDYRKLSQDIWLSVSLLRGCINRCAYCDECVMWKKARQRSSVDFVNELMVLKKKYNISGFCKVDSTLAVSAATINEVCDLLIENKLDLLWYSQARPEKWMNIDLLKKLRKAGCICMGYGVETGSQKMLDRMRKNLDIEAIKDVLKNSVEAEIRIIVNIMVDSPQETWMDYLRTVVFVIKWLKKPIDFNVNTAGIPFRSDWHNNPSKYNIVIESNGYNWHTKFYKNNYIFAKVKKHLLDIIKSKRNKN